MIKKKRILEKRKQKEIALKRIDKLFMLAEKEFSEYPELSNRYIELALKIAKKYNIKINKKYRYRFCKNCKSYLKLNHNAKINIDTKKKTISLICLNCKKEKKYRYK